MEDPHNDLIKDITGYKVLQEKYPELSFEPVVIGNNPLSQEQINQAVANIRLKSTDLLRSNQQYVSVDYSQKENWTQEFNQNALLALSDVLNVPAIFISTANHSTTTGGEAGHWVLALEKPNKDTDFATVFDPARDDAIDYIPTANIDFDFQIHPNSKALELNDKYSLVLDDNDFMTLDLRKRFQIDGYNCGPACLLNAILRANSLFKLNQEQRDQINQAFGIDIAPPVKIN
jgi:hypothetical protein